jgi:pimeloyl-ACP methyl ester carboxylesterase
MLDERKRVVALAGTLCAPAIFEPLASRIDALASVDAVSWMTSDGPWDLSSLAAFVAERIRGSGSAPVTLIGHSTGGAIAQQVALDHPELIGELILVDTGPHMHGHGDVDAIIRRIEEQWGEELFAAVLDRSFAAPLPGAERARFLDYAATVPHQAALQVLRSQRSTDFEPRLGELDCAVAIIHGTLDPTRTVDQARSFAADIPRAALHLLPAGHSPMYELPDEFAAILRDFWSGTEG